MWQRDVSKHLISNEMDMCIMPPLRHNLSLNYSSSLFSDFDSSAIFFNIQLLN